MTACAIEPPSTSGADGVPEAGCVITADGAYAARLAPAGDCWFPERWTLDGPEPYAVPLPGNQPEEPGTGVQPMGDGRVLIHRLAAGRHTFSLLYPTGPGTGELPLGAVDCPEPGTRLTLLPPAPGGARAYALASGVRSSVVWLVTGGASGPERLAEVPGRCSGGVWLDGTGRLLALDRELGGRTKTVVVDLERAAVSPLLQIADGSDDRLLLADPDSGLLLISSDAPSPGQERLGWGVLGSTLPVRFPRCLLLPDCLVTPFAIQPGQVLMPENCAVGLRIDGAFGTWVGTWRPAERRVRHLPAPEGWLAGTGVWTAEGVLRLPYATPATPCGLTELAAPRENAGAAEQGRTDAGPRPSTESTEPGPPTRPGTRPEASPGAQPEARPGAGLGARSGAELGAGPGAELGAGPGAELGARPEPPMAGTAAAAESGAPAAPETRGPAAPETRGPAPSVTRTAVPVPARPVPLQQAPLGRLVTN
ncbi:hypothetical protein [Streptomyces sp. NPDC049590]|uniref:hypothetical protein n=1 Tax=Streptomyces sp. NPDC049590 TaxID=3154834 RepID=UPI00343D6CF5